MWLRSYDIQSIKILKNKNEKIEFLQNRFNLTKDEAKDAYNRLRKVFDDNEKIY